jgi:hypothetical protein
MTIDEGPPAAGQPHVIVRLAGALSRALTAGADAPAWSMTADEQRAALVELAGVEAQLCELRLRVLAAADANDVGKVNGSSSTAAWVAHATHQERSEAHRDARLATALDTEFTATREALATGRVNEAQARVIVHAVQALPERATADVRRQAETHLLAQASEHDAKDLKVLGRAIFEVIDPDAADAAEGKRLAKEDAEAARKTWLRLRDNGDGTHSGSFKIPDLHAAMLRKALQALTSPRRLGQRRHGADDAPLPTPDLLGRGFCELLERYPLDRLPYAGGVNATVVVSMTLDQLRAELAAASLDTGGRISAGQARRLACEAGIIPVVLGGGSQPLDVGRRSRLHTEPQRVALAVRDGGCTAETCDRPASWCHAHHDITWADGGHTNVKDGRLLCPWHHGKAHDPAYRMTRLPGGRVAFSRRQ